MFLWFSQKPPYIPRKIWMFSDNPDIQINMDPRDNFIILTKNNYKGYVVIPEDISEHPVFTINNQRFRDLICVWVLAERGGIWINTPHQERGVNSLELTFFSVAVKKNFSFVSFIKNF